MMNIAFYGTAVHDILERFSKDNNFVFKAPVPASVQTILGTICKDVPGSHNDTTKWLYSRGVGQCKTITHNDIDGHDLKMANQIVFSFQVSQDR